MKCRNPIGCIDAESGIDSVIAPNYSMAAEDRPQTLVGMYGPGDQQVTCLGNTEEEAEDCVISQVTQLIADGGGSPLVVYANAPQTVTIPCGEGTVSYTTPAGYFSAFSQAAADAAALAFANSIAAILCVGGEPTYYTSAEQTCNAVCSTGGTASYTVPPGLFTMASQAEADAAAYAFACEVAALLCVPPLPDPDGTGSGGPPVPPTLIFGNVAQTCVVNCAGGGTYSVVVGANVFFAATQGAANSQANSLACVRANATTLCMSSLPAFACKDQVFSDQIVLSGGQPPITLGMSVVSGALPAGLSLGPSGQLTGTPTTVGSYSFTVEQQDAAGTARRSYTMKIVAITQAEAMSDGTEDVAYSDTIDQSGASTFTFAVTAGSLPPGLTLDAATGVISGTPTTAGVYAFTVEMTALT